MAQTERIRFARSADGTQIAWAVSGTGPQTLVLAANGVTNIKLDWESPIRRGSLAALSQHFRVVRYDHRGCGSSQRDVERQGLDAWVDDLDAVVEAAGVNEAFILLGKSQAGPHAIAYAARNPARLSHLVLLGGARRGARATGDTQLIAQFDAFLEIIRSGWGGAFPGPSRLATAYLIAEPTEAESRWHERELPASATAEDAYRFHKAAGEVDATEWLSQVRTPTLVMNAANDVVVLAACSRAVAAAIPGAEYIELPGANHILLTRDPGFALFLAELRAFVSPHADDPISDAGFGGLSKRERDVLEGVCLGLSNEAIAQQLGLSPKTVRNHLTNIFDTLGVHSRTQAALKITMHRPAARAASSTS